LLVCWTQTRMAYSICPEQRVILPKTEAAGIGTRKKNRVRNRFSWIDSACCRGSNHDALYNHSSRVCGISPEPSPFLDTRLAVQELLWE
jgi:hypothetical protein